MNIYTYNNIIEMGGGGGGGGEEGGEGGRNYISADQAIVCVCVQTAYSLSTAYFE